jgi:hypothetical protein
MVLSACRIIFGPWSCVVDRARGEIRSRLECYYPLFLFRAIVYSGALDMKGLPMRM